MVDYNYKTNRQRVKLENKPTYKIRINADFPNLVRKIHLEQPRQLWPTSSPPTQL